MKHTLATLCLWLLAAATLTAQAPHLLPWQGAFTQDKNNPPSSNVILQFRILQGSATGTEVFKEIAQNVPLKLGVANHVIGSVNSLATIDWSNGPYFLEVARQVGAAFLPIGTEQLKSVPYALSSGDWGQKEDSIYTGKNLGIGLSGPQYNLHIAGSGQTGVGIEAGSLNSPNAGSLRFGDGSGWKFHIGRMYPNTAGGSPALHGVDGAFLTISDQGRVGIGTTSPDEALHINGSCKLTGNWTNFRLVAGDPSIGDHRWEMAPSGTSYIFNQNTNKYYLHLSPNGNVGIGTTSAQQALDVNGSVRATSFINSSDRRIKTITGVSDSRRDLEMLNSIEITDYTFKDPAKGDAPQKKVIGQQVAEVFPQAVNATLRDVVPDIMQPAVADKGWVGLRGHSLQPGDKVRLVFEQGATEEAEVTEASSEGFRVGSDKSGSVLVYGREVQDFHVVDYDAIAMLNVSATQELSKQVTELKQQLAERDAQLDAALGLLQSLQQDVAALKARLPVGEQRGTER